MCKKVHVKIEYLPNELTVEDPVDEGLDEKGISIRSDTD